jgi:hypothetical protein
MKKQVPGSTFVLKTIAALACATCATLTLAWRDWLEIVFKIDPDHHNGTVEWLIVGVSFAFAIAFFVAADRERRTIAARFAEA